MIRTLLMAGAALAVLTSCASAPAAAPRPAVKLYALDCGRIDAKDVDGYADDGSMKGVARTLVDPCFLIRHPAGDLIWDTGLPEALADLPNGLEPAGFGAHISLSRKVTAQLNDLGLKPADIEFVSFSHRHLDHVGNGSVFAGSTWIVDKDERDAMFSAAARQDAQSFAAYSALENARTTLIEGDATHDVFGDGSVTIHQAPGHTPGHCVLLVKTGAGAVVLLSGDMWHLAESRERRLVPRFNFNRSMTIASMDKIEALARDAGARVVRQHVAEDIATLPPFPAALE